MIHFLHILRPFQYPICFDFEFYFLKEFLICCQFSLVPHYLHKFLHNSNAIIHRIQRNAQIIREYSRSDVCFRLSLIREKRNCMIPKMELAAHGILVLKFFDEIYLWQNPLQVSTMSNGMIVL